MHPIIRIWLVAAALAGIWVVGRVVWPLVATNLNARRSWTRTTGEVRAMNGAVEFEIGQEPSSSRAFAEVNHTWGLNLFEKVELFVDPSDPVRVKPAGFVQMWLTPAEMAGLLLLLLAAAWMAAFLGSGAQDAQLHGQWAFSTSPGPLENGVILHSPARQWKIVIGWSVLGLAMVVLAALSKGGNPAVRLFYMMLGGTFATALWVFAAHTKSLEVSANGQGLRMTSVLGWRDVPWEMVHGVEMQEIFTTYYNGNMRMWELPFPGSTARVLSFNDKQGSTLLSFSPELESREGLKQVFELCTQRTGSTLQRRKFAVPF
uniref:Uncharacterized protein n=1 Tax=Solibacter usitatus (strain Ellin6076) TaxID=234267 RepID=Q02BL6_SOLUE